MTVVARFQSAEQFQRADRGTVYIVFLDRPCLNFDWLIGQPIEVNGRAFRCAGVEATPLPTHRKGEVIGVLEVTP